jgi:hypothetical protein
LFSDAEELGWSGSFATQHNWARSGLVLNFEARGTSGPSYMLMETNGEMALLKNLLQQTLLSSIKLIDVQYL